MHKLKVEGHEGLYRDPQSGAIVNENDSELNQYMKRKAAFLANKNKMIQQENELQMLKGELQEIKQMLALVLEKNK